MGFSAFWSNHSNSPELSRLLYHTLLLPLVIKFIYIYYDTVIVLLYDIIALSRPRLSFLLLFFYVPSRPFCVLCSWQTFAPHKEAAGVGMAGEEKGDPGVAQSPAVDADAAVASIPSIALV